MTHLSVVIICAVTANVFTIVGIVIGMYLENKFHREQRALTGGIR